MSPSAQKILEAARQLPPGELDWLVENLLIASEGESEAQIAAAWDDEIKRRLDEIDSGAVEMVPGEEVMDRMIKRLSPEARARLDK